MTDQRDRIQSYVTDHPGIHFSRLRDTLGLANGQTQYHLHKLTRQGALERREFYGRTHYYPPDCPDWDRAAFALARQETARDILFYLLDHGPSRPIDVKDGLNIARSTLAHHIDHLTTHDVIRKTRDESNRVTLELVYPEQTVRVLSAVEPSLMARFADRFNRLVDNLFES